MANDGMTFLTEVAWSNPAKIELAPWNFKLEGDDETQERFAASLKAGKFPPVHVARCAEAPTRLEVVDGNHRVRVARALKLKKIPYYDAGTLTLSERKAMALRLNGTWFATHTVALSECLRDVFDADANAFIALPYTDADLQHALETLMEDAPTLQTFEDDDEEPLDDVTLPTAKPAKAEKIECPHCHKKFVPTKRKKTR
jgi:hypothetical protein